MALSPGTRLGPYEILSLLGAGGMGEVYRARDSRLDRDVAVKVLPRHVADNPEDRARFTREAKTISGLNHPNICVLHDIGRERDTDYLVLELVAGETLAERIARGPLPTADVLRVGAQIADALEYAHRVGVVHRDLKPSNVMLTKSGAKLMDFGLARAAEPPARGPDDVTATAPAGRHPSDESITAKGIAVGTVPYMSPEQLEGKRVDARSDLWALGCLLYEMATGKRAFDGTSSASIISAIMRDQPRAMTELAPVTPPALERLVNACLAKDPGDRIQTAHDVRLQLDWMAEGRATPETSTPPPMTGLAGKPRRIGRIAAALALVALIAWGIWSLSGQQARSSKSAQAAAKSPILVAEFDGPRSDPELTAAARQLVMAGLDQSPRFESVPRDAIKRALALAGRPESARVDPSLARELAFRNGIKVTVEGRIDRVGRTYSVLLTARDAEDGRALQSVTGVAQREDDLIKEIGELTQRLRKQLGERPEALVSTRIRWLAATPSFEAYRKYAEAFELQQMRGDDRGSIRLLNEALRIDPDFAEAWALKNFGHGHIGESDSARYALDEALKRPERLTEEGRMFLQGLKDALDGDYVSADRTYRELIRRGYQLSSSLGNHGWILLSAGRYEEALEQYRRAAHASPFGPQQWVLGGEIGLLLMFDRFDEARSEARRLEGGYAEGADLSIAVATGDWKQADSIATATLQDPLRAAYAVENATLVKVALAAGRGSVREARDLLDRAGGRAGASRDDAAADTPLETEALLAAAAGPSAKRIPLRVDRRQSDYGLVVRGLYAVQGGDLTLARQALTLAKARLETGAREGTDPGAVEVLDAYVSGYGGDWAGAAARLSTVARQRHRWGDVLSPILVRLLTAKAFERGNQPDSAAAYYEFAIDPTRLFWYGRLDAKIVSSFAHERLSRIYAAKGRQPEAERHWKAFVAGFTSPDPEYRDLLRR